MALDTFTSRRKLNITVLEGVYVYKVYRDSQNLSSDPTFRPRHLTHSHSFGNRDLLWPTEYKGGSEVYKTSEKNIMVL